VWWQLQQCGSNDTMATENNGNIDDVMASQLQGQSGNSHGRWDNNGNAKTIEIDKTINQQKI